MTEITVDIVHGQLCCNERNPFQPLTPWQRELMDKWASICPVIEAGGGFPQEIYASLNLSMGWQYRDWKWVLGMKVHVSQQGVRGRLQDPLEDVDLSVAQILDFPADYDPHLKKWTKRESDAELYASASRSYHEAKMRLVRHKHTVLDPHPGAPAWLRRKIQRDIMRLELDEEEMSDNAHAMREEDFLFSQPA
jgi:hypothetical protein